MSERDEAQARELQEMKAKQAARRSRGPHGPHGGMRKGEKPRDFKGTVAKLIRFLGRFKALLFVALLFAVGSTVFNIVGPKVLSTATTELFNGIVAKVQGTGGINFDIVGKILLFTLGLYLLSAACSFVQGWVLTYVSQKTCYEFRREIAQKIDRLPVGYFERTSTGDTLSRITNDVDTLGQSLNQGISQLITSVTTIIGVLIMMFSINAAMALVAILIIPVSLVLVKVIVGRSQKYFYRQQANLGEIDGMIEETFSGHTVVRAFNLEEKTIASFNDTNAKLYESAWKSQFLSGLMKPAMDFVGNLSYVCIAIMGGVFASRGIITVGDIQAFIQYVKNFTQPITQLAQVSNVLQQTAASAERVFEFLEAEEAEGASVEAPDSFKSSNAEESSDSFKSSKAEETEGLSVESSDRLKSSNAEESSDSFRLSKAEETEDASVEASDSLKSSNTSEESSDSFKSPEKASDSAQSAAFSIASLPADVEFDHVRFGYNPSAPVIKDFTASVKEGQTVALVGPTGAGKTTMVKLLMRFYDVQGGAIRLGGHDLREFSHDEVCSQFGIVLQDTWLFSGTVRENIRFGNLDATDEEVEQAARMAHAHHFIETLPGGYDCVINEDASNISQGQRQLLTIARAFLANRRMLILDEATSSVDTRTEERIQAAMDNLMMNRTSFVIAHRLSTIKNADLILVVRDGDIVEQGTHAQLLAQNGFYADLYNSQFADVVD